MDYSETQIEQKIAEIDIALSSVPKTNQDMVNFLMQKRAELYKAMKSAKSAKLAKTIQTNVYTELADWLHLCFCSKEHESGSDCRWNFSADAPQYNVKSRYLQIVSGLVNIYGIETLLNLKKINDPHRIVVDFYRLAKAFYLP